MLSHIVPKAVRAFAAICACAAAGASAANLVVTPWFPGYGQSINVELRDVGPAPFIPATRYRRDAGTIVIEEEHVAGGYFGARFDMDYVPLDLGEIAPGKYAVQARLYDISNPAAAPLVFMQELSVAPPDATGIYSVPRAPDAYGAMQLVVRADGPIDPASLHASVSGAAIRVDFDYSGDAAAPSFAAVTLSGLAPGSYSVDAYGKTAAFASSAHYSTRIDVARTSTVVEYYAPQLDHYFITAWPDETAELDANVGAGFMRTGQRFKAWLHASDAPANAVPVCRFYAAGPSSHFYTADAGECAALKDMEAKQRAEARAKGQVFAGWQYEAIAFYAIAAQGGACPAGTTPVYRAYNDRAQQNDSNHRFMVSQAMSRAMSMTWADEGVAFCSPS